MDADLVAVLHGQVDELRLDLDPTFVLAELEDRGEEGRADVPGRPRREVGKLLALEAEKAGQAARRGDYETALTLLDHAESMALAESIYDELRAAGVDVVLDVLRRKLEADGDTACALANLIGKVSEAILVLPLRSSAPLPRHRRQRCDRPPQPGDGRRGRGRCPGGPGRRR